MPSLSLIKEEVEFKINNAAETKQAEAESK